MKTISLPLDANKEFSQKDKQSLTQLITNNPEIEELIKEFRHVISDIDTISTNYDLENNNTN